jgi:hypothetical protein
MLLSVALLSTTSAGQVVVGRLSLRDGEIVAAPAPGPEGYMPNEMLSQEMLTESGDVVTATGNPEAWLRALPRNISGAYLRALLVEEPLRLHELANLIDLFFQQVAVGAIEIYNEFSLQHEVGLFLRSARAGQYKIQFERPAGDFVPGVTGLVKKEIDISVLPLDSSERVAIELKFPRNGQYPEQMFKCCQDIRFLEQLVDAGLAAGMFVMVVSDPLFYSGSPVDIYAHFRAGVVLHGPIHSPTGTRDSVLNLRGCYTVEWRPAGSYRYACIKVVGEPRGGLTRS